MMAKVAFLGTGIMGVPMAGHILKAGYELSAWNRSPDKAKPVANAGGVIAASPSAAVKGADYVVVMLSSGPVVSSVLFEPDQEGRIPADVLARDAVVIVMSSIPVVFAKDQAERLKGLGVHYIDAPVSGGEIGAQKASLTIMAGGEKEILERSRPLLEAMGRLTHVGAVGSGSLAKLANQMIVGITIGAVSEAMLLLEAGNADVEAVYQALMGGFADSAVLRKHGKNIIERQFVPGGQASVQLKDLDTASDQARATGLELPLLTLTGDLYAKMCEDGHEDLDHSGLFLQIAVMNGR